MWEVLLILVVGIAFVSLCWINFNLKKRLYLSTEHDADLLRQAAEHSIMASNTVNPLIALLEVCKSVQILELVNGRYGSILTGDYFMTDTQNILTVLQTEHFNSPANPEKQNYSRLDQNVPSIASGPPLQRPSRVFSCSRIR